MHLASPSLQGSERADNHASIVIPNWDGRHHLQACLDSIAQQTLSPLETILVDNGSTDDSIAFTHSQYPWVRIIALPENVGFARAVNRGIVESRGSLVGLLNNDTELAQDWLEVLTAALVAHPKVGSAACKMINYVDRSLIDAAGDGLTRFGFPYTIGHGRPDGPEYSQRMLVFGACAGAALYRRDLFTTVGLFDEDFISYYEDADLSLRAQLAGFTCLYVPEAICYHKRNVTGNLIADFPLRMQWRNLTAYFVKDMPASLLCGLFPFFVASRVRWMARAVSSGAGRVAWGGFREGMTLIPQMLRKRRTVQSSRTVPVRYIWSLMRKKI